MDLQHQNVTICKDVNVFIRGFDVMSKNSLFNLDISRPIYQFDKADLIFGDRNIVLLGKSNQFGSTTYASPVEIITSEKDTAIATAELLSWTEQQGRLIIDIKDEFYRKQFRIEFKDQLDRIRTWLNSSHQTASLRSQ